MFWLHPKVVLSGLYRTVGAPCHDQPIGGRWASRALGEEVCVDAGQSQVQRIDDRVDVENLLGMITQGGVGARSRWAMETAANAARTEGVAGVIVIQIPAKCKDYVDVTFTVGMVEVVSRWAV